MHPEQLRALEQVQADARASFRPENPPKAVREALKPFLATLDAAIAEAPDAPAQAPETPPGGSHLSPMRTGFDRKYARPWERPTSPEWLDVFNRGLRRVRAGGMLCLIGRRGTGKTQLAAEIARETFGDASTYVVALDLFLRLREAQAGHSKESERMILAELAGAPLLILDELQERGGSPWEDRVLSRLIDRRYAGEHASILIANLTRDELTREVGDSAANRLQEVGGIIELAGPCYRTPRIQ